jgi:hypothetical protein
MYGRCSPVPCVRSSLFTGAALVTDAESESSDEPEPALEPEPGPLIALLLYTAPVLRVVFLKYLRTLEMTHLFVCLLFFLFVACTFVVAEPEAEPAVDAPPDLPWAPPGQWACHMCTFLNADVRFTLDPVCPTDRLLALVFLHFRFLKSSLWYRVWALILMQTPP